MLYEIEFKKGRVGHREFCEYVGDIFIEVKLAFNDDGYALECQALA